MTIHLQTGANIGDGGYVRRRGGFARGAAPGAGGTVEIGPLIMPFPLSTHRGHRNTREIGFRATADFFGGISLSRFDQP